MENDNHQNQRAPGAELTEVWTRWIKEQLLARAKDHGHTNTVAWLKTLGQFRDAARNIYASFEPESEPDTDAEDELAGLKARISALEERVAHITDGEQTKPEP